MTRTLVTLSALLFLLAALAGCTGPGEESRPPQERHITMWVEQIDWEIHPGVSTSVWAFCAEGDGVKPVWGGPCGVPGPTIEVNEGDTIILEFTNSHHIPHTVHFHGWHPYAMDMNGNGALGEAMVVLPDETQTMRWVAEPDGTFIYHCHFETPSHMEMGMYGAFIVHKRGEPLPDVEQVLVLDEWQIRDEPRSHGNMPAYNFYTINGKSFPLTQPVIASKGEDVRLHMVNAGYEFHAMHVHGFTPDSWEGVAGSEYAVPTDVREIAPGQSVVLDFDADREGIWLMHDHVVPRVTAGSTDEGGFGAYPRGMLTVVVIGQQYVDQLTELVPVLLGAAAGDTGPASETPESHTETPAAPPTSSGTVVSDMKNFQFQDSELRVPAGTTVRWDNEDGAVHTVTDAAGAFDSGDIAGGGSWSRTFSTPGTFQIYCKPHAYQGDDGTWKGMVMTLVVE